MWRGTFVKPGNARIVTAAPPGIHALGSGWDATAGNTSTIFQAIGLGGTSGLRYPVGLMAEDNIQARLGAPGTTSVPMGAARAWSGLGSSGSDNDIGCRLAGPPHGGRRGRLCTPRD